MHEVTSIHRSALRHEQLNAVASEYLAVERVRMFRRLLMFRFGGLAVIVAIAGIGFHWLPRVASWFSLAVFLAPPLCAWIVELRRVRGLTRRLRNLPGATTHLVTAASLSQESHKKFISTRWDRA